MIAVHNEKMTLEEFNTRTKISNKQKYFENLGYFVGNHESNDAQQKGALIIVHDINNITLPIDKIPPDDPQTLILAMKISSKAEHTEITEMQKKVLFEYLKNSDIPEEEKTVQQFFSDNYSQLKQQYAYSFLGRSKIMEIYEKYPFNNKVASLGNVPSQTYLESEKDFTSEIERK